MYNPATARQTTDMEPEKAPSEVGSCLTVEGPPDLGGVRNNPYPLKLQALGKLIFYRRIAHVTPKKLKSCVFKR